MSHNQNEGENYNTKAANKSLTNVSKVIYFKMAVTSQNCIN